MLWLLVLHIAALLFWFAGLLYLPSISTLAAKTTAVSSLQVSPNTTARFVFTHIATPAALLAIMSGTALFLLSRTVEPWLLIKLTLVVGLVCCHAAIAVLLLREEHPAGASLSLWFRLVQVTTLVFGIAIITTVLAKPALEILPWQL